MYDITVIGAGPAGLTAALYARRAEKSVLLIEKATFGGQITHSPRIENYPGFLAMSGNEFAEKLLEQVTAQGADIEFDEVTKIEKTDVGFSVYSWEICGYLQHFSFFINSASVFARRCKNISLQTFGIISRKVFYKWF